MKIRVQPAEVTIPKDDPFKNDLLDRKKPAEVLTQLIDGIDGPCVLAIDAPWGAGKTTFLKMWSQHLRNEGYPVVEFNAWETDHAGDPFVALASELTEGLNAFEDGAFIAKTTKMAEASMKVARRAIPGVIRILTAGVLDVQPLIEKEAGKLLASYAENHLEKYKDDQESIKEFRQRIHTIANALDQSKNHPLVILIDELDRCRPSYAIALIEVAKHLFGVDHVVFVLAVNRTQLAHSIRALYGSDFDATGYLRRFIDIDFRLPEPDRTRFIQDTLDRIQFKGDVRLLKKVFGSPDFSLRQVGQTIHRLGLVVASTQNDRFIMVMVMALIIRTIDSDLYRKFARGELSDMELVDVIHERAGIREPQFEAVIVMAAREITSDLNNRWYDRRIESPLLNRYEEARSQQQKKIPGHAEEVILAVQEYEQSGYFLGGAGFGFPEAVRRIELLAGRDDRS